MLKIIHGKKKESNVCTVIYSQPYNIFSFKLYCVKSYREATIFLILAGCSGIFNDLSFAKAIIYVMIYLLIVYRPFFLYNVAIYRLLPLHVINIYMQFDTILTLTSQVFVFL